MTTAVIFFVWFVLLLKDLLYKSAFVSGSAIVYKSLMLFDTVVVFTCSFYVMDLLKPHLLTLRNILLHVVPYFVGLSLFVITGNDWIYNVIVIMSVVYCMVILAFMIKWMGEYTSAAENYYSNTDAVDIGWLRKVIVLFLAVSFFWSSVMMYCGESPVTDSFYYMMIMFVWGIISYRTKRQGQIAEEAVAVVAEIDSSGDTRDVPMDFSNEVETLFGEWHIARNPQLTMTDVVRMIGTNRNYFSLYLNKGLNVNFYDFINGYRLKDAETLLRSPECDLSQEEIAQQVGFNSISTFRRAFLKKYGMTPKKYRTMALQGVLPPP